MAGGSRLPTSEMPLRCPMRITASASHPCLSLPWSVNHKHRMKKRPANAKQKIMFTSSEHSLLASSYFKLIRQTDDSTNPIPVH